MNGPALKLSVFTGKLLSRVVLAVRVELILMVDSLFRKKLLTFVRKSSTHCHSCVKKLSVTAVHVTGSLE